MAALKRILLAEEKDRCRMTWLFLWCTVPGKWADYGYSSAVYSAFL